MRFIADLHIHSKYSRACSPALVLENIDVWCRIKGLDIVSTGDFTHPRWFEDLKKKLEPAGEIYRGSTSVATEVEPRGLYVVKKEFKPDAPPPIILPQKPTLFILGTEISCIYSQGGKTRRVHNCIYAPNIEVVGKIIKELEKRGCKLKSDGRPIIGMSSKDLLTLLLEIDERNVLIPAHCLLPDTLIHTKKQLLIPIEKIKRGDYVFTHKGRWERVNKIMQRSFSGKVYNIRPYYFRAGLTTTPEHPFFAIKTHKNCHWSKGICKPSHSELPKCKGKNFINYKPTWVQATSLEKGDVLVFPRFKCAYKPKSILNLEKLISSSAKRFYVRYNLIIPNGTRGMPISRIVKVDKQFCRLIGYYLAEGHSNGRDAIGFTFHKDEVNYIHDVIDLLQKVFGMGQSLKIRSSRGRSCEVIFYSRVLQEVFQKLCYDSPDSYNAGTKAMPSWMLGLDYQLQAEIIKGWWRGDKGYTSSRILMNQMKIIFLRLGIIPSIYEDTKSKHGYRGHHNFKDRTITANYTNYAMNRLAFFEDPYKLLEEKEFASYKIKTAVRHGWIDKNYVYLPIRDISTHDYEGQVYNLEVENDNSYISEFAVVHNCWTPWFAIFGSKSGFDSIAECFGDLTPHIFAIETGLSSDPKMNWRIKELDKVALVSSSDAHSLPNLGREANVFEGDEKDLSYDKIMGAIRNASPSKMKDRQNVIASEAKQSHAEGIAMSPSAPRNDKRMGLHMLGTIEFIPDEGRYHYDGHRDCKVSLHPSETKKAGGLCPKCKKPVTVGVLSRVEELAAETEGRVPECAPQFWRLVELDKIIAEAMGIRSRTSKVVNSLYWDLIKKAGNEINVLLNFSLDELNKIADERIVEAIKRVREGKVKVEPGYDGEYGVVQIFSDKEKIEAKQRALF